MPSDADRRREELRQTFETVPALYDRVRPTYPDELFVDLAMVIRPRGRVLEIGPGTGQATLSLAERGFEVVAVELGAALAAFTRAKLAAFPRAEVVNGEFERTSFGGSFDAVVAFTSFHWIDPALRYAKAASLLRREGVLAVTEVSHVRVPDDDMAGPGDDTRERDRARACGAHGRSGKGPEVDAEVAPPEARPRCSEGTHYLAGDGPQPTVEPGCGRRRDCPSRRSR